MNTATHEPTPVQQQARAMATTREQLDQWQANALANALGDYEKAVAAARLYYAQGDPAAAAEVLAAAGDAVAAADPQVKEARHG